MTIDTVQVSKGITALYQYEEKKSKTSAEMLDNPEQVVLLIGLQKVPSVRNKIIKIPLPHSLLAKNQDVCVFVKDLDKNERDFEPTVRHFKELFEDKKVNNITEVIPIKALKTEYQPFEAKRNLSNMYDAYLADERINRLLPSILGKHFYARKRWPLQVNLQAKDLKQEINRALSSTQCIIGGRGAACQVKAAHTGMTEADAVENVVTIVQKLMETLPGGPNNIKSLHVKTEDSPALLVYMSTGSGEDVDLPTKKPPKVLDEPEEVSTIMNSKVRVTPHGYIEFFDEKTGANLSKKRKRPSATKQANKKSKKSKASQVTGANTVKSQSKSASKSKESEVQNIDSSETVEKPNKETPAKQKKGTKNIRGTTSGVRRNRMEKVASLPPSKVKGPKTRKIKNK